MNRLILLTVLLCFLNHGADMGSAWDDKHFFNRCLPHNCGNGPEIEFPLWFGSNNTSSSSCGSTACTKLVCSNNGDTILLHPFLVASKVTAVDYKNAAKKIIPLIRYSSACPIQELTEPASAEGVCDLYYKYVLAMIIDCSREITAQLRNSYDSDAADHIASPISCLNSNPGHFTCLMDPGLLLHYF